MKTNEHFSEAYHEAGLEQAILTTLPDIFVLGQAVRAEKWLRFCRNNHNTDVAISRAYALSEGLGEAWERHADQDARSHDFEYAPYQHKELEKPPEDSVFLLSAGLDSFAAWRLLGQPKAVYFAIGHKAQHRELSKILKIRNDFDADITIDSNLHLKHQEMDNGYIPYRNLYFLMMASQYSPDIILSQIEEWAPDKNKKFYKQSSKLLEQITTGRFQALDPKEVKVHTPFAHHTKSQLVHRFAQEFDIDELTEYTVSCYAGSKLPCGKCNACISRFIAMRNNGVVEQYEEQPDTRNLTKRLDIRDFRLSKTRMILKRYFEMRGAI